MELTFSSVTVNDNLQNLNLTIPTDGITVIYDETEKDSETLLRCLIGLDHWQEGEIYLDQEELGNYLAGHALVKTFAYVFEDATMLSNLSLRENLHLPYQLRWEGEELQKFDENLAVMMERFGLNIDLQSRPAFIKPAERKMLCFIQAMLLKPLILLINNPLFLFNHRQRKLVLSILSEQAKEQSMIIASSDVELLEGLADRVISIQRSASGLSIKSTTKT